MKLTVLNKTKETKKEIKSPILEGKNNETLIAQALRVYTSNQRQGTVKVQTRSDVTRTKKKWYKQKGTGGARHGARSANIFVGGGAVHGPSGKRNWSLNLSKKMKNQAFIEVLTKQAQAERIVICDELKNLDGKTKVGYDLIKSYIENYNRVLVLIDKSNDLILRSLKNIDNVLLKTAQDVSLLEISLASVIIVSNDAFQCLEKRLLKTEKKPVAIKKQEKKEIVKTEKKEVVKKAKPKIKTESKKTTKQATKKTTKKSTKKTTEDKKQATKTKKVTKKK